MIIDTHIHLSHVMYDHEFPFLSLKDDEYSMERGTREELIERIRQTGIRVCIDPAIDIESNGRTIALAEQFPGFLYSAVGVHPSRTFQYRTADRRGGHVVARLHWEQRKLLDEYADSLCVAAIGETGLDYHNDRKEQHRIRQKMWFVYQLKLAHRKMLPVILHIREADEDAIRILKRYRHCLHGGVCHCFNGSPEFAKVYTELGLMLGIGGSLLSNSAKKSDLELAVMSTPLEYIVLETDGPYVKPDCPGIQNKQLKKARNTSLIIPAVAKRIAELKHISVEEVCRVTSENAVRLFRLRITDKE